MAPTGTERAATAAPAEGARSPVPDGDPGRPLPTGKRAGPDAGPEPGSPDGPASARKPGGPFRAGTSAPVAAAGEPGGADADADASRPGPSASRPEGFASRPGESRVQPLSDADPLPPLGAFPLPERLPVRLLPPLGTEELLLLHTDGTEEARDAAGRFFPLAGALEAAVTTGAVGTPEELVDRVQTALLGHTGGRLADDVALLAVRPGMPHVPAGRTAPATTGGTVSPPSPAG
nr:SpoIIE family protein phosphatase [Streptomyces sp. F63]